MHEQVKQFLQWAKGTFPLNFQKCKVLDVGAGDINGNNRYLFKNCDYTGNDVVDAPNVTTVCKTKDLPFENATFDTIVSTECFEHDPEYEQSFLKIYDLLKPEGLFVFTCASTGRPEHGTRRTSAGDSYGTIAKLPTFQDYYQNLTEVDLNKVLPLRTKFATWDTYYNNESQDLYFLGVKTLQCGEGSGTVRPPMPQYFNTGVMRTSYKIL